jgi:hypothetical protein
VADILGGSYQTSSAPRSWSYGCGCQAGYARHSSGSWLTILLSSDSPRRPPTPQPTLLRATASSTSTQTRTSARFDHIHNLRPLGFGVFVKLAFLSPQILKTMLEAR